MTTAARLLDARDPLAMAEAAALVRAGGLVVFPTETVYGLGADAFDARAVARLFAVKRRPTFDPLIVHLAAAADLSAVARSVPPAGEILAARFWPGPLTLVLPKTERVPPLVTAGLDSVGVRVPAHPAALALLRACGRPIAAPSANPFGYVSPTTAAHVAELLGEHVDLILDGGPCTVGVESTIVSLVDGAPVILRPGGVPREALEEALGRPVPVAPRGARPQAPGQLESHYAPRTPLRLLAGPAGRAPAGGRVGLLAFAHEPPPGAGYAAVEVLAPDGDLTTAAANLFAALRRLDSLGLDALEAEPCPAHGLGWAVLDRLHRASASRATGEPPGRPV